MLTRPEAEDFLFQEARLLDERRYEEWLELFAPDGVYWLPIVEDAAPDAATSLIYDESVRRRERVYRLLHTPAQAQHPPSRTVHCITNVCVDRDAGGEVRIYSNQVIYELRPNRPQSSSDPRAFVGRCEHHLKLYAAARLICLKKLILMNRDAPIGNLTFIL
jgi:3-phenylpropionate/cinnamic acid dioxygenase small subunit